MVRDQRFSLPGQGFDPWFGGTKIPQPWSKKTKINKRNAKRKKKFKSFFTRALLFETGRKIEEKMGPRKIRI